ncbi:Uncharacterised protein [Amycolatopsis camponoti]|uniref:Uncharacterized protein n=1 Tax=Amycolatopsis camponoti TaxID=2606593 RepID=A0A6I8LQE7_9PSEU|nr:hypothetical protein [Amycolatopsis camponoti]VVJ19280.1 Uncharacterised protein [Amycolatopsis camponoti]
MKMGKIAATGAVAAGFAVLGFAAPAQAAEPAAAVVAADNPAYLLLAPAPNCVGLAQGRNGSTAWAEATNNNCGYTVRVRMIWAWAGDGPCVSLPNNYYYRETRGAANIPPRPYVSELRSC